jgi:hypothetical protein
LRILAELGLTRLEDLVGRADLLRPRADTVVEGVGDHACEYMTGVVVVVLGLRVSESGGGTLTNADVPNKK